MTQLIASGQSQLNLALLILIQQISDHCEKVVTKILILAVHVLICQYECCEVLLEVLTCTESKCLFLSHTDFAAFVLDI